VGECFFWYRPTRVVPDQRPLNGRRRRCCCLSDSVVDADMINTFKSRLDKHWLHQDVVYNFYSESTGTRGASVYM